MNSWIVRTLAGLLFITTAAPAGQVKPDEQIVFFPTLGWRGGGGWELEIHGCVYEPEQRRLAISALRKALGLDDDELSAAEMALWQERSRFFFVDNERGKEISLRLGGEIRRLPRSAANGHFQSRIRIDETSASRIPGFSNGAIRLEASGI